jgi:hypothetical protein
LYHDILGVLPYKLNGEAQKGETREESAAPGAGETDLYSYDSGTDNDLAADGSSEAPAEELQEEADRIRIMLRASEEEKKAAAPPDQVRNSAAEGVGVSGNTEEGVFGNTEEGVSGQDAENIDDSVTFRKEASTFDGLGC